MPEIGEVARIVRRLNTHLVGKIISSVQVESDKIIFRDTSTDEFRGKLQGRTVQVAKQWGKYFWLVMDKPPHLLMHLGMTGWIKIKDDPLSHYRAAEKLEKKEWPPKFHKFVFTFQDSDNEIAFIDARRLGRVRLIDHPDGHDLRNVSPLKENGLDPVLGSIELGWLQKRLEARKVPIKTWLLDQSEIAGIGNWVGDEILFQARIHPECYTHNLTESYVAEIHKAILYVTKTAVETDADSSLFPKSWLMPHRWGKGKKGNKLPSGELIEFLKVGGRTSAYVRKLQRKVGPVTGEDKASNKRKKAKRESDEDQGENNVKEDTKRPSKKISVRGRGKQVEQSLDAQKQTTEMITKRKITPKKKLASSVKTEPSDDS